MFDLKIPGEVLCNQGETLSIMNNIFSDKRIPTLIFIISTVFTITNLKFTTHAHMMNCKDKSLGNICCGEVKITTF